MPDDDDERHRREQADLRAKRKQVKSAPRSDAQREKERKRKEHTQKILQQHGSNKRRKPPPPPTPEECKSAFQELFAQRAQGFQVDFRFRNAPPRPPVGPCFVGSGLDGVILETSKYKPLNAVEVNHQWKLHTEPDLAVPLAPSAMDLKSYTPNLSPQPPALHPDDESLLNWTGSLGDTAADELKRRRDHARASARLALIGKTPTKLIEKAKPAVVTAATTKKAFSRVLDETMQSWMKKTTYLTNDYSRKVHDFKSLAQTKQDQEKDLEQKQQQILKRRSAPAISKTFLQNTVPIRKHPNKKNLRPVSEMPLLPDVDHWGQAYTHIVMDKSPGEGGDKLNRAFVANVQKRDANARMTCQLFIPSEEEARYQAIQQFELDVIPLKEEDAPHVHFAFWVDAANKKSTYVPISSRVQLSTGRPLKKKNYNMIVSRRSMNATDISEMEERVAEVDLDVEERIKSTSSKFGGTSGGRLQHGNDDSDDSDDDSDRGSSFVNTNQTIVAEG